MTAEARGPRSSGHRYNFLMWTYWDWARFLLKVCMISIFFSMIQMTFQFWFIPRPNEYPGIGDDFYPTAATKDFSINFSAFLNNYKLALILHFASLSPFNLFEWILRMIAFSITYILISKLNDIALNDVVQLGPKNYINLTMGSILMGIILLTSGSRSFSATDKLMNSISIGIFMIVLLGLERLRKSILTQD